MFFCSAMKHRGRPPGSNRERSDWDALLQEHRATQPVAQGGAANAGAAGAAPLREQQLARAQTARLARSDQLRSRQPVATLLRGSLLRPWLQKVTIDEYLQHRQRVIPFVPLPFDSALARVWKSIQDTSTEEFGNDADDIRSVARDLFQGQGLHMSDSTRCQMMDTTRQSIVTKRRGLAAAAMGLDILFRGILERGLAASNDFEHIAYIDYERYDEVTLPVTAREAFQGRTTLAIGTVDDALAEREQRVAVSRVSKKRKMTTHTGVTRILQSSSEYGMLVAKKQQGPVPKGPKKYAIILGKAISGLQCSDRSTGEVMREMAFARSGVSLGIRAFKTKLRVTMSDACSSNKKTERQIKLDRSALKMQCLSLHCAAHVIAAIHTKTMDLVKPMVSGVHHLAKSVQLGGMMGRLRRSLKSVIKDRMVWPPLHGQPTVEATQHRCRCIGAMTSGSRRSTALQQRVSLQGLPLGDLRKLGIVETYYPAGVTQVPDKEEYSEEFSDTLSEGLMWFAFERYRLDRWFGAESAVSQPLLVVLCHGLLLPAFMKFCEGLGTKVLREQTCLC